MRGSLTAIMIFASLVICDAFEPADPCDLAECQLPDCKCSTPDSGSGIPVEEIPQIVLLSFDDAVTGQTYDLFDEAFSGLKNPDGCPIGVTHFLNHEYTDYAKVHNLWASGHEIALHSVSHTTDQDYWRDMNSSIVEAEFGDLRKIINYLAGVPESDIYGVRFPFLQTAGNYAIQGLKNLGLLYDSSLPSQRSDPAYWPYTYDYATTQECDVPPCADASFPGVWEVPMTTWTDQSGIVCSMVDACVNVPTTAEPLLDWLVEQFNRHYKGSRAPFPVFMHAAWFLRNNENFVAYKGFIEHLQSLDDVYIVNVNRAIKWIQDPKPISVEKPFGECETRVPATNCVASTCQLTTITGEYRWMTSCATTCPKNYPWLGNPYGV